MSNLFFYTGKNYMKRDTTTQTLTMAAPVTGYNGSFVTRSVITHSLGIIPMFELAYEGFKDGVIWPAMGDRIVNNPLNPRNTATTGPSLLAWPTTTTLTVELGYPVNTLTGTYPVYVTIYRDYGIA